MSLIEERQLEQVLYGQVRQGDSDRDYEFHLRGFSLNPMIDVATPLLGLVLSSTTLLQTTPLDTLQKQVITEIKNIEQELRAGGYEPSEITSFRYVLCTFIDEAIMSHSWGSSSTWSSRSLLVYFYQETWGGEKVFKLLDRLMMEPKRYADLLAFIYLCFCLGFKGRYKVRLDSNNEFRRIVQHLYECIAVQWEDQPQLQGVFYQDQSEKQDGYLLGQKLTTNHLIGGFLAVLVLCYGFYALKLNGQTQDILNRLNELLS